MNYDPILDAEFSSSMGNYLNRYVNHSPLSDESIARRRRFTAFLKYSGLIEESRIPSFKHGRIAKKIPHYRDHVSYYWLGGIGKIPFLLTEPYTQQNLVAVGVRCVRVPVKISPYGGGPFATNLDLTMPASSFLCVREIHGKYLDEVSDCLTTAAEELPAWNSVSDDEREAAKLIHRKLNCTSKRWCK